MRSRFFRQIVQKSRWVRVSGGDLGESEAPTEAGAETILSCVKGFLCEMTKKDQADSVQSRQAVFVRCCLNAYVLKALQIPLLFHHSMRHIRQILVRIR